MSSSSAALIQEVIALLGSPAAAAEALRVGRNHVGRVRDGNGGLGIVPTVRAAVLVGRDPVEALKAAGEDEAAEVLPTAFGAPVTVTQRKLLKRVGELTPSGRRLLFQLLDEFERLSAPAPTPQPAPRRKR